MPNIFSRIGHSVWRFFRRLVHGDGVSSRFFKRHIFATGFIITMLLMMIAMRFDCLTSSNTIDSLNEQIRVMETEKQKQRSRYMTLTRESAMMHMVDSLQLGLTVPDKRPVIVNIPPQ